MKDQAGPKKGQTSRNINQRQNILVHITYCRIKILAFNHKLQDFKDMINLYQQFCTSTWAGKITCQKHLRKRNWHTDLNHNVNHSVIINAQIDIRIIIKWILNCSLLSQKSNKEYVWSICRTISGLTRLFSLLFSLRSKRFSASSSK